MTVTVQDDRLYRKVILRIIPFICLCYIIAMIDRLNIGYAKLQFLGDLNLTEVQFGVAASFFYVGYILFEIPSNLMLHRLGIGLTFLRIMTLWGVTTVLLAFVTNALHFYGLRFTIGLAEAGFVPGVILYITYWFPERLRGRMTSIFMVANPAAGIIGGPLAGWILTATNNAHGIAGWRYLFLIEGLPAIILGVTAFFYLPRGPQSATWLTADEKARIRRDLDAGPVAPNQQPHTFAGALASGRVWTFCLVYFLFFCVLNALLVWTPTLLRSVGGISIMNIGWLSGAISVVAMIGTLVLGAHSDRRKERRWHVIGSGLVLGLSFALLPLVSSSLAGTAILLSIASVTAFSFVALFWTIPSAYLRGTAAAGGLALISSVGAIGGVLSPIFIGYMKDLTGGYYGALGTFGVAMMLGMPILYACTRPATRHEQIVATPATP